MTDGARGPWPIRLKRSPVRLVAVVGSRALVGVAALVTAQASPGTIGTALNVAGLVVFWYAAVLAFYLLNLRLVADAGELRLYSPLGVRRYQLVKGTVTRLRLPRTWRSPLEAGISGLGVRIGEGELKGEKLVGVIALDRPATLLIVPAVGGRVAVAAESEEELLNALAAATS